MSSNDVLFNQGTFVGRVWSPDLCGPSVVCIRDGLVIDITSKATPTMRDLLEMEDPVGHVNMFVQSGVMLGRIEDILNARVRSNQCYVLAPFDLQAIKACGVTFARSMIERVIEERAAGDLDIANNIRSQVEDIIGQSLSNLKAGSSEAANVKRALVAAGIWSQYLEVGIGPDAEVFTKSQVMSAVGHNSEVGLHPISTWNNPEPEVVLAVDSRGRVKGATLGNDVNLRDIEGRSALLLGKAKDNNASCAIGPFIRLFDESYTIDDVRAAKVNLRIEGKDGYVLDAFSSMSEISRDPLDLVSQTIGRHHQYPDGLALFMGTMFAPTEDRDVVGSGFTHKIGDVVSIYNDKLGELRNYVNLSTECVPWSFGVSHLMRNLFSRELL